MLCNILSNCPPPSSPSPLPPQLSSLTRLQRLSLVNAEVESEELGFLASMPSVTYLRMESCDAPPQGLGGMTWLRHLEVCGRAGWQAAADQLDVLLVERHSTAQHGTAVGSVVAMRLGICIQPQGCNCPAPPSLQFAAGKYAGWPLQSRRVGHAGCLGSAAGSRACTAHTPYFLGAQNCSGMRLYAAYICYSWRVASAGRLAGLATGHGSARPLLHLPAIFTANARPQVLA